MHKDNPFEDGQFLYPLEIKREKMRTPFEEYIHQETTSGIALLGAVVLALILANTALAQSYLHVLEIPIAIGFGKFSLSLPLVEWINEFLMVFFFFVVGLEIKREVLIGELADLRAAALPVIGALGGMLMPALIFSAINQGTPFIDGWGIPMATDIAFCVGLLVLLGTRAPKGLSVLLVALAIVDDLGAVLVIALFYTSSINLVALGVAGFLLLVLFIFNLSGVRRVLPYFFMGLLLWLALLFSGVHATVAGVLVAFFVPARARYTGKRFARHMQGLMERFESCPGYHDDIHIDEQQESLLTAMRHQLKLVESPLQRLEEAMHLPVALMIIPLFALANAGIPLDLDSLGQAFSHSVTRGIICGLFFGKLIGIAGFSWLAVRIGIAKLPDDVNMQHVIGMGLLGGIGFTMSIFIAELSFPGQHEVLNMAKTGIFAASLLSGVAGYLWLLWVGRAKGRP